MLDETIIVDHLGTRMALGERVELRYAGGMQSPYASVVIVAISDPDGDVDDEGRAVAIYPSVKILYDDGVIDSAMCSRAWTREGVYEVPSWVCADLVSVRGRVG